MVAAGRLRASLLPALLVAGPWGWVPASALTSSCPPGWAQDGNGKLLADADKVECPYGRKLPFDVTFNTDFHHRRPVEHFVYVVYGFVPIAVVVLAVIEFFIKRGTRELQFVLFIGVILALNELLLKRIVNESRPVGSCNLSCGMPSGHSTMSIGFLMLMFLDSAFRVCPTDPRILRELGEGRRLCGSRSLQHCMSVVPLASSSAISNLQFVMHFSVWAAILAPVPLSRVMLNDHTGGQVFIGSCIGVCEAALWYCGIYRLARRYDRHLGWRYPAEGCFHLIVHNFKIPTYQYFIDIVRKTSTSGDGALELVGNLERIEERHGGPGAHMPTSCHNLDGGVQLTQA